MSTDREIIAAALEQKIRGEYPEYSALTQVVIDNDLINLATRVGVENVFLGSQVGYSYYELEFNVKGGFLDDGVGVTGAGKLVYNTRDGWFFTGELAPQGGPVTVKLDQDFISINGKLIDTSVFDLSAEKNIENGTVAVEGELDFKVFSGKIAATFDSDGEVVSGTIAGARDWLPSEDFIAETGAAVSLKYDGDVINIYADPSYYAQTFHYAVGKFNPMQVIEIFGHISDAYIEHLGGNVTFLEARQDFFDTIKAAVEDPQNPVPMSIAIASNVYGFVESPHPDFDPSTATMEDVTKFVRGTFDPVNVGESTSLEQPTQEEIIDQVLKSVVENPDGTKISQSDMEMTFTVENVDGTLEEVIVNPTKWKIQILETEFADAQVNGIVISETSELVTRADGSVALVTHTELLNGENRYFIETTDVQSGTPSDGVMQSQKIVQTDLDGNNPVNQNKEYFERGGFLYETETYQNEPGGNVHYRQNIARADGNGGYLEPEEGSLYVIPSSELLSALQSAGSTIGGYVASHFAEDNVAKQIIYSAALKTLGEHFGTFGAYLAVDSDFSAAIDALTGWEQVAADGSTHQITPEMQTTFLKHLSGAAASAAAGYIVNEVGEALGIDGTIGGEIFSNVAGTITTGIANEVFGMVFQGLDGGVYTGLASGSLNFNDLYHPPGLHGPTNITVGDYVQLQVLNAFAGFAGARLAGEVIEPESEMAALFGSAGGAVGTAIATGNLAASTALGQAFATGALAGPVGIAIAVFVGTVFGTALGNVLGGDDNPSSWGMLAYNKYTKEYYMTDNTENDGGGLQIGADLAAAVSNGVNSIIESTGGNLRSTGVAQGLTIGWKEGTFLVIEDGGNTQEFDNSGEAISYAAFKLLKGYDLVGGHAVVMRAWHNSEAGNLQEFKEDIEVAEAFIEYLQNPTGILALMMDQPDSALAQSWAAILQRAAELELHLPHEKDLDGGWNEVLIANGIDPESLPNLEETTLTVTDPVTGEDTVFHHLIGPGYEIVRIEGTDGNDIIQVIVDGPSIAYVDAGPGDDVIEGSDDRDVIFGGTGDDIINGNDGDDWLNGGAGNDTINGNNGLDLIVGGDDNDILTGGDNGDSIYGGFGEDVLTGGAGVDYLYGGGGNDILNGDDDGVVDYLYGGAGNDTIHTYYSDVVVGGAGNDLIVWNNNENGSNDLKFQRGDGHDTVQVNTTSEQYIAFDSSIGINELWFHEDPNNTDNLIISVLGENQSVTVLDYKNTNMHVEVMEYYYLKLADLDSTAYAPYLSVQPTGQYNNVSDANTDAMSKALDGEWLRHNESHRILWYLDSDNVHVANGYTLSSTDVQAYLNHSLSGGNYQYWEMFKVAYDNNLFMYVGNHNNNNTAGHNIMGGIGNDTLSAPYAENGSLYAMHFYGDAGDDTLYGGNKHIEGYKMDRLIGGSGNDYIYGDSGNDQIWGGTGIDTLRGGNHNDNIWGGADKDYIYGGYHDDRIFGGDGDDELYGDEAPDQTGFIGNDTIHGDAGNDQIWGGLGEDTLDGGADDDIIHGNGDNDVIIGGTGDDTLYGDEGNDVVSGDDGNDTLYGGVGNDQLVGGTGDDTLYGESGDDSLAGSEGNDTYHYLGGLDTITEIGTGLDSIVFSNNWSPSDIYLAENSIVFDAQNILYFNDISLIESFSFDGYADMTLSELPTKTYADFDAHDDLFVGMINTVLTGNLFDDNGEGEDITSIADTIETTAGTYTTAEGGTVVIAGNGDFTYTSTANFIGEDSFIYTATDISGTADSARVKFALGHDTFVGTSGYDSFTGNHIHEETDILVGYAGNDYFNAEGGDDIIYAGAGNDQVHAGAGSDIIYGGSGDDDLRGNGGDDVYIGGDGFDILKGLSGSSDTFVFEAASAFNDVDWIEGFDLVDQNVIDISDILNEHYDLANDNVTDFIQITDNGTHSYLAVDQDGGGDDFIRIAEIRNRTGLNNVEQLVTSGHIVLSSLIEANDDWFAGVLNVDITGNVFDDNGNGYDKASIGSYIEVLESTFTTVQGATVVISQNGDFTYTPTTNFIGEDSFIYTATDISGTSDSATVRLALGHDTFIGDSGNDSFTGNHVAAEIDIMVGYDGDDYFNAEGGDDIVYGGGGDDQVHGGAGNDTIYGNDGNDDLRGNNGDDILIGGAGSDILNGSVDNDILYGGAGVDILYGGSGSDTFVFNDLSTSDNIQDFNISEDDKLDVSDLLIGYDPLSDAISDFVQITESGGNSYVNVDADGGADNFVQIAYIYNETGLTNEEALETSGNLITV